MTATSCGQVEKLLHIIFRTVTSRLPGLCPAGNNNYFKSVFHRGLLVGGLLSASVFLSHSLTPIMIADKELFK